MQLDMDTPPYEISQIKICEKCHFESLLVKLIFNIEPIYDKLKL